MVRRDLPQYSWDGHKLSSSWVIRLIAWTYCSCDSISCLFCLQGKASNSPPLIRKNNSLYIHISFAVWQTDTKRKLLGQQYSLTLISMKQVFPHSYYQVLVTVSCHTAYQRPGVAQLLLFPPYASWHLQTKVTRLTKWSRQVEVVHPEPWFISHVDVEKLAHQQLEFFFLRVGFFLFHRNE